MSVTPALLPYDFFAGELRSGHYQSVNDIIAQGLGMLRAQEEFIRSHTAELREKIAVGLEQVERGDLVDGGTAIRHLREKLQQRGSGAK
jgi:antitoxin ParD1/3/4